MSVVTSAGVSSAVYVGQRVLIEVEFRLNGVPTDPTVVSLTTRSPDGSASTLTYPQASFTRRDLGLFEADVLVDEPGTWAFRAEGAGVVDAVNEYTLSVVGSSVI